MSEALNPACPENIKGAGGTLTDFVSKQKGVRFVINAGFNHYRKNFYKWPHQNYEEGDPVGLVKIRENVFKDQLTPSYYGYFVQEDKFKKWDIKKEAPCTITNKYILGSTPLLIFDAKICDLPLDPILENEINPPSYLGHGMSKHPRTAVGLRDEQIYFVVVDTPGCTLEELQKIGQNLGLQHFLNLDGGGSSQFMLKLENGTWLKNQVPSEDEHRVLGHVIALFEESLKTE